MARVIIRSLTFLILLAVALAATAPAQSMQNIRANIPFDFTFNGKTFPAGEYTLVQPFEHSLALRDFQGNTIAQVFTNRVESAVPADKTKLKFEFTDGEYILREIWHEQALSGESLHQAKSQLKLAKRQSTGDHSADGGQQ